MNMSALETGDLWGAAQGRYVVERKQQRQRQGHGGAGQGDMEEDCEGLGADDGMLMPMLHWRAVEVGVMERSRGMVCGCHQAWRPGAGQVTCVLGLVRLHGCKQAMMCCSTALPPSLALYLRQGTC